ncbi:MAG: hypothetical protein IPG74_00295 [Flavobacteriales bacterium]|nr:hypothetical protein [Flavobacteriales bacterium]
MKHIASRLLWSLIPAALLSTVSLAQGTAINTTGAVAAPSAILDVASTTRGILIPRMIEAQRLAIPTLAANNGLWVYQIADPGNSTPNGLWYYDATAPNAGWYRMSTGNGWLLAGNSGTNPATNFLGTTDGQPLIFATQAVERMRLGGTTSFLGIANNNPVEALSVTGAIHMTTGGAPGSLTDQAGVMRYNTAPVLNAPYPAMVPQIPFHQGNTTGAATGWDRLENAFTEVHPAPYNGTQLLCGNGTMDVPNNGGISNVPTPTFSDTPYPTSNGRGSKRQYVFTGAELVGWGLCPGPITEVAFRITSDDIQLPAPASVQIQIRLSNVPAGTTLVGGFDRPTSALAPMGTLTTVVAAGVQPIPDRRLQLDRWRSSRGCLLCPRRPSRCKPHCTSEHWICELQFLRSYLDRCERGADRCYRARFGTSGVLQFELPSRRPFRGSVPPTSVRLSVSRAKPKCHHRS